MLLTLLDGLVLLNKNIFLLAASNSRNSIDEALRRPGRLDREIEIGVPNENSRLAIFRLLLAKVPHNISDHELKQISDQAHGYVGADINLLIKESVLLMIKDKKRKHLEATDIYAAFSFVKPSALREVLLSFLEMFLIVQRSTLKYLKSNGVILLAKKRRKHYFKKQLPLHCEIHPSIWIWEFDLIKESFYMDHLDAAKPF